MPVVGRLGQMQRLLGRSGEFVDDDRVQPLDRLRRPPVGVRLLGSEGEQSFAGETGDGEHGGLRGRPGVHATRVGGAIHVPLAVVTDSTPVAE